MLRATQPLSVAPAASSPAVQPVPASCHTRWRDALCEALEARGIHPDGAIPSGSPGANAALPSMLHSHALWQAACAATGDPAFGLEVARCVQPASFHALGYAVLSSGTLREAIHRFLRHEHLVCGAHVVRWCESSERGELWIETSDHTPEGVDALFALLIRTARALLGIRFRPLAVHLRRPVPENEQPYRRAFRCAVTFAQPHDAVILPSAILDVVLRHADPALAEQNERLLAHWTAESSPSSAHLRLRALLASDTGTTTTLAAAARSLAMSERTLSRHLASQGTSFAREKEAVQCRLARVYLTSSSRPIGQVAVALGFHDASAFSRAFRRWTGTSPSEFRLRAEPAAISR